MDEKCVMIIDENLPIGLIANTTAVLGATLGKINKQIIGNDVCDLDNKIHPGIVNIPIPILKANSQLIRELLDKTNNYLDEISVIDFCDLAQSCKDYEEYTSKMKLTSEKTLNYSGICLFGNKKRINKLTGNLPLLR
ncbi:MAG: DUF2000 domain-containing protein [Thomasclavelia sp.]|uniref:DUF2000 domain-containing protein n=1 Tax=Thomasclavelia sp. TaxID=3025757 RepID=UPI0039A2001D